MRTWLASALFIVAVFCAATVQAQSEIFLVSHAGLGDPFWRVEFKGATAAAEESGVSLSILAPETPNDITRQLELLHEAIAAQPDGIATTVPDPVAFSEALRHARDKGIPVIAFNARPLDDDRNVNPYLAFIGMDDYLAGRVMAERAWQSGKLGERVVVAIQQASLTGLEARYKGIRDVLDAKGVLVERLDVSSNPRAATSIMEKYVAGHPDLGAILCLGPIALHPIGALALREGWRFYMASFDLSPVTDKLIKQGLVDFTIDQQPYMQGYLAVALLRMATEFKMTPPDVNTGVGIIDKDNVGRVEELAEQFIR